MLEHYYDLNRADDIERLFGTLAIGCDPTPLRNRYFVEYDIRLNRDG